jgi:alkylhydroperoxidase family enzyme
MPRIPYKPTNIAEPHELIDSIRARRGGHLLNLDRMLLHSPAFAKGWNTFFHAVRSELSLSPKLRELAICTVAMSTGAEYEFSHHSPELLKAGGTTTQVEALHRLESSRHDSSIFDAAERAVIQLAIEMTRYIAVSDSTFSAVKSLLDDQQLVELVGAIATYNMVSRFLLALGIEPEQH